MKCSIGTLAVPQEKKPSSIRGGDEVFNCNELNNNQLVVEGSYKPKDVEIAFALELVDDIWF